MKQVVQNYRTGELRVADVPAPVLRPEGVLVRNSRSIVSVGTEKLMMDLARKSLLGKALARPDLVKQVINKVRTDGLLEAYRQAVHRLDSPVPLGYSCAGTVIAVGNGVEGVEVGSRVACFGSGYASHAEVVFVPKNLYALVPDGVSFDEAAFAGVGAIALHSVRCSRAGLGERVVVIGLGLLGLIAVQLLKASGCRVCGVDLDPDKVRLAGELGADVTVVGTADVVPAVEAFTGGVGADAVIVLASSADSQPVELAAEVARDRARIVVPGMVKLDLPRKVFYEKELELVVSRSAGPGIYDPTYERKGVDYPLPYVRWTEQRNMQEFLHLVAAGKVRLGPLITHRFSIDEAERAYDLIQQGKEKYIAVLLTYPETQAPPTPRVELRLPAARARADAVRLGVVGAGLFANTTLLPILKGMPGVVLRGIATASGFTGQHAGRKFGFEYCTTDYRQILEDPEIDCVLILTRHNLHARMVVDALRAGKHVFVEKPLALTTDELRQVVSAYESNPRILMVGFNRRFSPFTRRARELMSRTGPLFIHCRVNAGPVPRDSWVVDAGEGGGRILGEVCHFVDLAQYLAGANPVRVYTVGLRDGSGKVSAEDVSVTLNLADGSVAHIGYVACGDKAFSRERVEIFGGGSVCVIDDFRRLIHVSGGSRRTMRAMNVDRGHRAELEAFISAVSGKTPPPVSIGEYIATTVATIATQQALVRGEPVPVNVQEFLGGTGEETGH